MLRKIFKIFVVIISIAFSFSCQKKFASFQQDSSEDFRYKKNIPILETETRQDQIVDLNITTPIIQEFVADEGINAVISPKEDQPFWKKKKKKADSKKSIFKKKTDKPKKKKKRKRINPMYNDSLKIGTVFLIITATLGIMGLSGQIVLVFAMASIFFLYLGLKKYLIRRRFQRVLKK